jgi:RND family efflux transporter MFP subunit
MSKSIPQTLKRLLCVSFLALALPAAMAEEFTGLVYPEHELTLSLGQGGIVSQVQVKPGQNVKAKQVLLVLDDRMQQLEVNRRKVLLDDRSELAATVDRARVLKNMVETSRQVYEKTGSVSRDELSRLEVEYSAARARVEQLEAQERRELVEYRSAQQELNMRRLTAPVSGVITRVQPKVGEWAKPGDAMLDLVDTASCYLKVNVPMKYVQGLHPGMSLPIRFENSDAAKLNAKISFVSAVADPASGLVEMRLAFANPQQKLRPGVKGIIDLRADGNPAQDANNQATVRNNRASAL